MSQGRKRRVVKPADSSLVGICREIGAWRRLLLAYAQDVGKVSPSHRENRRTAFMRNAESWFNRLHEEADKYGSLDKQPLPNGIKVPSNAHGTQEQKNSTIPRPDKNVD